MAGLVLILILVVAISVGYYHTIGGNRISSSQSNLNSYVKNQLAGPLSSYKINGTSYKPFNKSVAISNIMKSFYMLENESVFQKYYDKASQNFTASLSAVYSDYNNTTDAYGLKQVYGIFQMYYDLPETAVNGTVQPQYVQYVDFTINAATGNISGPGFSEHIVSYAN